MSLFIIIWLESGGVFLSPFKCKFISLQMSSHPHLSHIFLSRPRPPLPPIGSAVKWFCILLMSSKVASVGNGTFDQSVSRKWNLRVWSPPGKTHPALVSLSLVTFERGKSPPPASRHSKTHICFGCFHSELHERRLQLFISKNWVFV